VGRIGTLLPKRRSRCSLERFPSRVVDAPASTSCGGGNGRARGSCGTSPAAASLRPQAQPLRNHTRREGRAISEEPARAQPPSELTQITRAIVGIYKAQLGRGPVVAHTHYAGSDIVICVLEGTLTPIERTLVELGQERQLQDIRQLFQFAAELQFRAVVEEITGRSVISFMSGNDVRNDVASEIFSLERRAI
jgi:uncharacterized protein YbcI